MNDKWWRINNFVLIHEWQRMKDEVWMMIKDEGLRVADKGLRTADEVIRMADEGWSIKD